LSQFNYFGPRNFSVFASYYTETLLYSNFRGPLFLRTCQAREIREIKGTRKKNFFYSTLAVRASSMFDTLYLKTGWRLWISTLCTAVTYL